MRDLTLIAENINSFVVRSLETALIGKGLSCKIIAFKDGVTDDDVKDTTLFVVIGCDEMEQHLFTIQNLKAKCLESDKHVVTFALHDENEFLMEHLSDEVLIHEFVRPMPPADLAEGVFKICTVEANKKVIPNILVIDDSGMTLRTMMEWLNGPYTVRVVNSALKASPMIEETVPDLILLDYEMPDCSGADFFQLLKEKEETRSIPVVFLTSKDDIETVKSVLALRPAGYVLKTTTKELLIERIDEVLNRV